MAAGKRAPRGASFGDCKSPLGWRDPSLNTQLSALNFSTAFEQQGDAGGNGFCFGKTHPVGAHDCSANLHALWDDILTTPHGSATVDGIAAALQQRHGKPLFLGLGNYEGWARESYKVATTKVYPATLFRRAKPVPAYYSMVLRESEARLALAGYRLGEGLNALLR